MKKNYEKYQLLFTSIFILFLIYVIFIDVLLHENIEKYIMISGRVFTSDVVEVIVTSHELKYLNANRYVYIKDKKYNKKIIEVNRNILKKDKKNYHDVKIEIKLKNNYKINDSVVLRVKENHEKIYNIFRSCWKEE